MSAALAGFEAIAASSSKHYSEPGRDLNLMSKPERRGVFRFCAAPSSQRRCQSNGGSSTRRAHALFQMTIYAARARHSADAAERLCL
jgi:hypothetical protein